MKDIRDMLNPRKISLTLNVGVVAAAFWYVFKYLP